MLSIALAFEDGLTHILNHKPGETIADAAVRQGVNIPLDCWDGVCGTCKARRVSGQFDLGSYLDDVLTREEAEDGYCLACQSRPLSDCVIEIAATSSACRVKPKTVIGEIDTISVLSPRTLLLRLSFVDETAFGFLPGQYVNLGVPGSDEVRAFSFCSTPAASVAEFLIKDVTGGLMSRYLKQHAKPGDRIEISGPYGSFYLRPGPRPILMVAGGTGLAPLICMIRSQVEVDAVRPIHLIYGVSKKADLVLLSDLDSLSRNSAAFTYLATASDGLSEQDITTKLTKILEDVAFGPDGVDLYVCGPPKLVESVKNYFANAKARPHSIYYEKFTKHAAHT